jgi:hypothetical protein
MLPLSITVPDTISPDSMFRTRMKSPIAAFSSGVPAAVMVRPLPLKIS